MEIVEFNINVPWGHIAVKTWGDKKNITILCFHGFQDNAGSFDLIIPLLPKCFYYVCIDLPGHGRSSHFSSHVPIYTINYLIAIKLLVDYFFKENYIIMGHSFGGIVGYYFAQLYPKKVTKLIMFEGLYKYPISTDNYRFVTVLGIETFIAIEEKITKKVSPKYTYEEALEKIKSPRLDNGVLPRKAAEALLQRCIHPVGDGKYILTIDQHLKNPFLPVHDARYQVELIKKYPVHCPILIILGNQSAYIQPFYQPIIEEFESMDNIKIVKVDGDHDVHNINTEEVADLTSDFLLNVQNKL